MERALLTIIVLAAAAFLVRVVWRSVRAAANPNPSSPACGSCPLANECGPNASSPPSDCPEEPER